jgi:hypothetical protein
MAAGVLQAGATEGGVGGVGLLQGDDVVLMISLVGVEGSGTGGSTRGRAAVEEGARWSCRKRCWDAGNRNWWG